MIFLFLNLKKMKTCKNKINIYRDKTVCFSGKKFKSKYNSSNYISETKMKLSDETHSLQLNQY